MARKRILTPEERKANAVESQRKWVESHKEQYREYQRNYRRKRCGSQRWIDASKMKPDEGVWVLVWEKQGFAYSDKLVSGVWQIGANNGAIITHWMPLPEGPKEGADA